MFHQRRPRRPRIKIYADDMNEALSIIYNEVMNVFKSGFTPFLVGYVLYIPKQPRNRVFGFPVIEEQFQYFIYNIPVVYDIYKRDGTPLIVQGGYFVFISKSGEVYPCSPEVNPIRFPNLQYIRIRIEIPQEYDKEIILSDVEKEILYAVYLRDPTGLRFIEIQRMLEMKGIHIDQLLIQSMVNRHLLVVDKNGRYHVNYMIPTVVEILKKICVEKGTIPPNEIMIVGYIKKIKELMA